MFRSYSSSDTFLCDSFNKNAKFRILATRSCDFFKSCSIQALYILPDLYVYTERMQAPYVRNNKSKGTKNDIDKNLAQYIGAGSTSFDNKVPDVLKYYTTSYINNICIKRLNPAILDGDEAIRTRKEMEQATYPIKKKTKNITRVVYRSGNFPDFIKFDEVTVDNVDDKRDLYPEGYTMTFSKLNIKFAFQVKYEDEQVVVYIVVKKEDKKTKWRWKEGTKELLNKNNQVVESKSTLADAIRKAVSLTYLA